jgi:hypothetical protein
MAYFQFLPAAIDFIIWHPVLYERCTALMLCKRLNPDFLKTAARVSSRALATEESYEILDYLACTGVSEERDDSEVASSFAEWHGPHPGLYFMLVNPSFLYQQWRNPFPTVILRHRTPARWLTQERKEEPTPGFIGLDEISRALIDEQLALLFSQEESAVIVSGYGSAASMFACCFMRPECMGLDFRIDVSRPFRASEAEWIRAIHDGALDFLDCAIEYSETLVWPAKLLGEYLIDEE